MGRGESACAGAGLTPAKMATRVSCKVRVNTVRMTRFFILCSLRYLFVKDNISCYCLYITSCETTTLCASSRETIRADKEPILRVNDARYAHMRTLMRTILGPLTSFWSQK